MNKKIKKYGLLVLAFMFCVSLNYNPQLLFESNYRHWGWQFSLITVVLILLIFRIRDPLLWKRKLGIDFKLVDWLGFLFTTVVLLNISYFLVDYLSRINGYSFRPKLIYYQDYYPPNFSFFAILGDYFYYIPETFNEEIFIGALLLMGLERNFKRLNKNVIVIGVAFVFSLLHQALYKWSPVQSGELLSMQTIISLFFVGVIRNALILKTKKIAYSWAIHLSFNIVFFSGFYINNVSEQFASEPETFNIVFGNKTMVLITGIFAFMSLLWMNRKKLTINPDYEQKSI